MNDLITQPQKVFSLTPTTDPITLAILDARRVALADDRLSGSMKAFFCEVLDRSLNPRWYKIKGIVTVSDPILAQVFRVSMRTIYTWKTRLAECGHIWLTKKGRSNMWPITTYHLSCIHREQLQEKTDEDGTYGSAKVRHAPMNPGLGCRKPGQPALPLPGSRQHVPEHESAKLQAISGGSREKDRARAEELIGSDPKKGSGESRSKDRVRPEERIGSDPKPIAGVTRSEPPARPEENSQHRETQVRESVGSEVKGEGRPPLDLKFEGWRKSLEKLFPRELEKMKADLGIQLKRAKPEDRADWKRRLSAVEAQIYGGKVPEEGVTPRPALAAARSQVENPPASAEEVLEGARYLLSVKKGRSLTPLQKAALETVGEL